MPITKTMGYVCEGKLYATVEEAQMAALGNLLAEQGHPVLQAIMDHRAEVLEILTTGPTSRPGARKKAGTTSPKRAAKRATEAQATAGFKAMREATQPAQTEVAEQAA